MVRGLRPLEAEENAERYFRELLADLRPDLTPSAPARKVEDVSDAVDAKIAAAEARSQAALATAMGEIRTEFANLRGDLKALDTKVAALPGRWTVFGAALTAVGIVLAALALGNDMFSRGFSSQDVAQAAATKALADFKAGK